jgi:arsenical pump membrane protein
MTSAGLPTVPSPGGERGDCGPAVVSSAVVCAAGPVRPTPHVGDPTIVVNPASLAVSVVVLVAALLSAVSAPRRIPPAAVAVAGGGLLVSIRVVRLSDAASAVRQIAPTVGFLVLILLLGHLADRERVFTWAAAIAADLAGRPSRLLSRVVVLAAVVTAVLSLDATVVLLVPVVLAIAARLQVPHRPYSYAAGHLANSASLLLPVSNLTNLLAFAATGLSFLHFTGLMLAPWLVAVSVEYLLLRRFFHADLAEPGAGAPGAVPSPPLLALSLVGLTVAGCGLASAVGFSPLWPIGLGVALLAGRQLVARTTHLGELLAAANPSLALFVLGLAVIALAVRRNGVDHLVATVIPRGHGWAALLAVACIAAVAANLLNNLPATLTLLPVAAANGPATALALLIGVNIGPNLTYVGSLANLLWRRALNGAAPSARSFSAIGVATVPLTLLAATTALWAVLQF